MTMAGAVSKRRRFRYAKELRRYKQLSEWQTVAAPTAPKVSAVTFDEETDIVYVLFDKYSAFNRGATAPIIEVSANGTSGWAAATVSNWVAGSDIAKVTGLTAGNKYFRAAWANTFGQGPYGGVAGPVTIPA